MNIIFDPKEKNFVNLHWLTRATYTAAGTARVGVRGKVLGDSTRSTLVLTFHPASGIGEVVLSGEQADSLNSQLEAAVGRDL